MFHDIVKQATTTVTKNSPRILTAFAAAGVVTTAILSVRATPKALEILEKHKPINYNPIAFQDGTTTYNPEQHELTRMDMVKLTWKCYIPALAMGAVTVACVIGLNTVHGRRTAALASAYSITERAMKEYQAKIVEHIGEEKEKVVRDSIAKDHVDNTPVQDAQVIVTGRGETLCFDRHSGRYFKSDMETLRKTENTLNQRLIGGTWLSLNELYSAIGLEPIKLGDELGWVPDNLLQFSFSAVLATDGTPCIALDYGVDPKYDPYR